MLRGPGQRHAEERPRRVHACGEDSVLRVRGCRAAGGIRPRACSMAHLHRSHAPPSHGRSARQHGGPRGGTADRGSRCARGTARRLGGCLSKTVKSSRSSTGPYYHPQPPCNEDGEPEPCAQMPQSSSMAVALEPRQRGECGPERSSSFSFRPVGESVTRAINRGRAGGLAACGLVVSGGLALRRAVARCADTRGVVVSEGPDVVVAVTSMVVTSVTSLRAAAKASMPAWKAKVATAAMEVSESTAASNAVEVRVIEC